MLKTLLLLIGGWRTLWGLVFQRVRKLTALHGSLFPLSRSLFTSLGMT